jgi:hypothetical protein
MTENDSYGGTPFILERKVVSREGAGIRVVQLTLSQAWRDGMMRAAEQGREYARQRTLSYRIRKFFSRWFSKTPERPTGD